MTFIQQILFRHPSTMIRIINLAITEAESPLPLCNQHSVSELSELNCIKRLAYNKAAEATNTQNMQGINASDVLR
jgi:hypothetical protein